MLHSSDKDLYWHHVEMALKTLDTPTVRAKELRHDVDELDPDTQELFYHAEPLSVARDLAELDECTPLQIEQYLKQRRDPTRAA